jgi:hypothetical protein
VDNIDANGHYIQFIVGAAIGGLMSLAVYFLDCGISNFKVKWWKALIAFGVGAANGALAASGSGLLKQIIGNVTTSIGETLANGGTITKTDIIVAIITGVVCGIAGGAGLGRTKYLNSQTRRALKLIVSTKGRQIAKSLTYFIKSNKKLYKSFVLGLYRSFRYNLYCEFGGTAAKRITGE